MEEGVRSGGSSGVVVKNRSSSGCLIVRRKGDALAGELGSSGSRKVYVSKKEKKRRRLALSDSGSSDEPSAPRRRVGPETIRVCNDLTAYGKGVVEESERKRDRLEGIQYNGDDYFGKNGLDVSERKRSKLDVFEFDEYDSTEGERMQNLYYDETGVAFGRRFSGSMHMGRSGAERDFEAGSSRHGIDKRKNAYFERMSSMNRGNQTGRLEMNIQESFVRDKFTGHPDQAIRLQGKNGVLKVLVNKKKGIGVPLAKFKHQAEEHLKVPRMEETVKKNVLTPFYSEEKIVEKPSSSVKTGKRHMSSRKSLPSKNSKSFNWDSDNSDTSLKQEPENVTAIQSSKRVSLEGEDTPCSEKTLANKIKEGRVKRGSGTEKQKLREKIRGLLVDAGWTIDYRPRRNRDYLDAVYINPAGTAYWSIIKAYDALQKQLNDEDNEIKPSADGSTVRLIADEDLCQLTRKTRKKIETELKMKQRDGSDSENAKEVSVRRSTTKKHDSDSMDSASHDEKLSSFIKQGSKSFKSRMNENGFATLMPNGRNLHDTVERATSGSNSHMLHGRKSKKLGRCTLLIRSSNKGLNSETDGFVPYTGKRTVLTWLIESGVVQLSQKVQYKNRRRTRVMLEGWITRDGIHCGCCSKILTISKFELHAGSKLRQPYQNIFLESGVSLTQCQIDAWNGQEGSEHLGFHSVNTDGDDPNDDTCGICGDGGDLICCDGCPSTFHQSCLDIEMLPPGDWHCPNCTCKFCGIATETVDEEDDTVPLLRCSLCEKKYHESCAEDICASSVDSSAADPPFCGPICNELFEHLQKYVGVKHDLEGGFSWSLTRRTDDDSKITCNSKLAVAMAVMDECFLPIVDRRSGINIIRNVLYNCGSNFNRLSYGGFYSAILERGDEIISAASIRFHGTKLAEMPFIGTRHIYRRQGMCRRLFSAIESALCSFKVEKLIIPAISELTHTWTDVFGFTPLEEALKHEMRSMNMLVFPGIDMLQKVLGEQEHEANNTPGTGHKQYSKPELAAKSDIDLSTRSDPQRCDDTDLNHVNETTEVVAAAETKSGTHHVDVPNHTIVTSDSLNAPFKPEDPDQDNETALSDTPDEAKISVTMSNCKNRSPIKMSPVGAKTQDTVLNEPVPDPVLEDNPLPRLALEDNPLLGTALEDEPMSDRALEVEPLSDGALEDEPLSDRALEDEPLSDPALEDVAVTSVLLDTSLEHENPDPINYITMCRDSPSGAKSSDTSSNSASPDNVATENKPSTVSVLEDKSEASSQ